MANPIFNGDTFRKEARSGGNTQTYSQTQTFQPYGETAQGYGQTPVQPSMDQYQANAGRLTFDDVMTKTLTVFGLLAVGAVASYIVPLGLAMLLAMVGAIGGLVLGLVNSFKAKPSPALIGAYAVLEGLFAGGFTRFLDARFPGIGLQALLATACIFAVTFFLFRSGKVRATPKLQKFFMIAMSAYLLFSIVNLVLMLTNVTNNAWGLRGVEIAGIPLGAIIGVGVIVLGAISLIMDFDQIQGAISVGAPKYMAWTCAFGLLVTVVWLYMEVLRLLAIIRGDD